MLHNIFITFIDVDAHALLDLYHVVLTYLTAAGPPCPTYFGPGSAVAVVLVVREASPCKVKRRYTCETPTMFSGTLSQKRCHH